MSTTLPLATPPRAATVVLTALIPFGCGYYLSYLFRTMNAVISPHLVREFSLEPADLGFLTSVYFITFAAMQIPLGVILDRYGPRRVQTVLLLVAALGAAMFAIGDSLLAITIGRGLIGVGVASCLMSSFKANALWWPRERLALMNNLIMAFGGVGALSATAPVHALLTVTDWRTLFVGLAIVTAALAVVTFLVVPERRSTTVSSASIVDQFAALPAIFRSRVFWRYAGVRRSVLDFLFYLYVVSDALGGALAARCGRLQPGGGRRLHVSDSAGHVLRRFGKRRDGGPAAPARRGTGTYFPLCRGYCHVAPGVSGRGPIGVSGVFLDGIFLDRIVDHPQFHDSDRTVSTGTDRPGHYIGESDSVHFRVRGAMGHRRNHRNICRQA
ncbi:MAG: MFS transporter [Rhodospirillales bacterium]|nr:MFS transporter [Rhodospirillales bacterium]